MKKSFSISSLILVICSLFIISCSSSNVASNKTGKDVDNDEVKTANLQNLTLADYLRRIPGLQVQGSGQNVSVTVRGSTSVSADNSPLYVIDRNMVGNDYAQVAAMIDPNDIASVNVLKDAASTSSYGLRGANGVVVIKTKKN
ncbi:MAG: TonB-dependent receptor plug domain-containing protein [Cyclobacteriaceae bacterium]